MDKRTEHRTSAPSRLRFVLGNSAIDVALPADVPLVDLLPAVLPQLGAEWVEQGTDHEGWVAQRLGGSLLDEDRTPGELHLADGETVCLRPRAEHFDPVDHDDLIDGIGERIRKDPGAWTPLRTRWMLRLGAFAALLAGLLVLLTGGDVGVRAIIAGSVAVLLVAGAGVVARAALDAPVATMLATVAVCYAAVAGWLFVAAADPASVPMIRFTCAALAALFTVFLGLVAVADAALLFTGALTAVALLLVPALISSLSPLTVPGSAAVGLVVTLIVGYFLPGTAFRLGGLSLPMLPTEAEELKEDTEPVTHRDVVERGAAVVGYLKALHVGVGLAQLFLLQVLIVSGGTWPLALTGVLGALLFLRARHLNGTVQRWSLLVPAGCAMVSGITRIAIDNGFPFSLFALWIPLMAVGIGLIVLSGKLPGKRLRPYWGRAVDIFELLTAIGVLPVLLAVLDVYAMARGLAG